VPTPGRFSLALLAAVFFAVRIEPSAHAQSRSPDGLRYDLWADIPVTAGAAGVALALELLKGPIAPRSCRVCGVDGLDAAVRGALRWDDPAAADAASDWTGFVLTPAVALGTGALAAGVDHRFRDAPSSALVIAETTALAVALDDIVKLLVARQRPYVHFADSPEPAARDADANLSFYSGHTNLAFAVAVASGTVASMRGYRLAPVVWATSLPLAAVTGYLRVAADKHYFTDVLTGALVGAAAGFLVPFVFHRASAATPDPGTMPAPQGRAMFVASSWTF